MNVLEFYLKKVAPYTFGAAFQSLQSPNTKNGHANELDSTPPGRSVPLQTENANADCSNKVAFVSRFQWLARFNPAYTASDEIGANTIGEWPPFG